MDDARRGAALHASRTDLFWQATAHILEHDAPVASRAVWERVWMHVRAVAGPLSPAAAVDACADALCVQLRLRRHELEALFRLWPLYPWLHITFHSSLASRDERWRWHAGSWDALWDGLSMRANASCSVCARLQRHAAVERHHWDVHRRLLALPLPPRGVSQARDLHAPLAPRRVTWVFVRGRALLIQEATSRDFERMHPHEREEMEEALAWVEQQERDTYQRRRRPCPSSPSVALGARAIARAAGPSVLPHPPTESTATPTVHRCPCCC